MDPRTAAHVLRQIAAHLELNGESTFKVRAYEQAATALLFALGPAQATTPTSGLAFIFLALWLIIAGVLLVRLRALPTVSAAVPTPESQAPSTPSTP